MAGVIQISAFLVEPGGQPQAGDTPIYQRVFTHPLHTADSAKSQVRDYLFGEQIVASDDQLVMTHMGPY